MALLFLALVAAVQANVATNPSRITNIRLEGTNLVVTADIPSGVQRAVLESCPRSQGRAWTARVVQRVTGPGKLRFVVPANSATEVELFRVRMDDHEPLPAEFYSGQSTFPPELAEDAPAASASAQERGGSIPLNAYSVSTTFTFVEGTPQSATAFPVDCVLPTGDWLVEFSGAKIRVSAATNPHVEVSGFQLDDLPVLGVARMGDKIHVLQRRSGGGVPAIYLRDVAQFNSTNRITLQHVVLEAGKLPQLTVAGITNAAVELSGWLSDPTPLWPRPGLLVWAFHTQSGATLSLGSTLPEVWTRPVMWVTYDLDLSIGIIAPTWPYISSPWFWSPTTQPALVAVEVENTSAPHIVSALSLDRLANSTSDLFAAGGLVMQSHATRESKMVSTNYLVQTNATWIEVTNRVWRTNIVVKPITITETNPTVASVDAVKMQWPGSLINSHLTGGQAHSLVLNGDGTLFAWGDNGANSVVPEQVEVVPAPVPMELGGPVSSLAAGLWRNYALNANGEVWQWGLLQGQTPPTPGQTPTHTGGPERVPFPDAIASLAAGGWHALALGADGRLWTWGRNNYGQLGSGDSAESTSLKLVQLPRIVSIAGGASHSLALDDQGRVFTWGRNDQGQLGRSGTAELPQGVTLPDGLQVKCLAGGLWHSLALAQDGSVWGWGNNQFNQLGVGGAGVGAGPRRVEGLPVARQVVAGWLHTLVLGTDGSVWYLGQEPDGADPMIARVASLTNVVAIGSGVRHSLALTADGRLFSWGRNLGIVGGAGEETELSFHQEAPSAHTRTMYVSDTNVWQEEVIKPQRRTEVVTNAVPVWQHWNRHWLEVVDYSQDPTSPVRRPVASLPGTLQGVSHGGAMLYTITGSSETTLTALAYDEVAAHLVGTMILATNRAEAVLVGVQSDGVVGLARNNDVSGLPQFECWQLSTTGQFLRLGMLERPAPFSALKLLGDIAVLRTERGIDLVNLSDPSTLSALPVNASCEGRRFDLNQINGDRRAGIWLATRDAGSLLLWKP